MAKFGLPAAGWTLFGGVVRPKSRGRICLRGPNPLDPIQIEANFLSHPDDMKAAIACVKLCREIGNSAPLRPFTKREVMPGNLKDGELENFIRDAAVTYWHQTCTAKMGRDSMSVVDGNLESLRNRTTSDCGWVYHATRIASSSESAPERFSGLRSYEAENYRPPRQQANERLSSRQWPSTSILTVSDRSKQARNNQN
jgi:hypothetical protein